MDHHRYEQVLGDKEKYNHASSSYSHLSIHTKLFTSDFENGNWKISLTTKTVINDSVLCDLRVLQ